MPYVALIISTPNTCDSRLRQAIVKSHVACTVFESWRAKPPCGASICEADASIRETGTSIRETGTSIRETGASIRETGASILETGESIRETGASIRETGASVPSCGQVRDVWLRRRGHGHADVLRLRGLPLERVHGLRLLSGAGCSAGLEKDLSKMLFYLFVYFTKKNDFCLVFCKVRGSVVNNAGAALPEPFFCFMCMDLGGALQLTA